MRYELRAAADHFLASLKAERDVSPHTLNAYRSDLEQFTEWSARGHLSDIRKLDRRHLRRYVSYLVERRYARRTIARKVSGVKSVKNDMRLR